MADPTPRWLGGYSAQDQILDIQIGSASLFEVLESGIDTVQSAVNTVDSANQSAQKAFNDLAEWYSTVTKDLEVPAVNLIDAVNNLLQDAYRMGVYVYATVPDYGGYDYLKYDLEQSLKNPDDPSRPVFSEGSSMGGVVILISGTLVEIFMVSMLIAYLRGAPPSWQEMADKIADRIFAYKSFLESVEGALMDSAGDINEAGREIVKTFQESSIGKMAGGFMDWANREFDTETVTMNYLDVKFLSDLMPSDKKVDVRYHLHPLPAGEQPPVRWDPHVSPGTGHVIANAPFGGKVTVDALSRSKTGKDGKALVLKRFVIETKPAKDPLSELDRWTSIDPAHPEELFGRWQQVFRPAGFIPGATRFVSDVSGALDTAGATITEVKRDADNLVETAIGETADALNSIMNRVTDLGDGVVDRLRSAIYDLTNLLKAHVLYVPPQAGGTHQFTYALEQYLSNEAPGAPFMGENDFVAAIVLAAAVPVDVNDPAATPVVQALKNAANMFPGINIE